MIDHVGIYGSRVAEGLSAFNVGLVIVVFLLANARCKQPSGELFLLRVGLLLCLVCDAIWLVPVRFWRTGPGWVVRTLGIIAGGGVALRLWGPRSKLGSSTWINSLITDNYPAVSAQRHVLMFPPYTISKMIFLYFLTQVIFIIIWPDITLYQAAQKLLHIGHT